MSSMTKANLNLEIDRLLLRRFPHRRKATPSTTTQTLTTRTRTRPTSSSPAPSSSQARTNTLQWWRPSQHRTPPRKSGTDWTFSCTPCARAWPCHPCCRRRRRARPRRCRPRSARCNTREVQRAAWGRHWRGRGCQSRSLWRCLYHRFLALKICNESS